MCYNILIYELIVRTQYSISNIYCLPFTVSSLHECQHCQSVSTARVSSLSECQHCHIVIISSLSSLPDRCQSAWPESGTHRKCIFPHRSAQLQLQEGNIGSKIPHRSVQLQLQERNRG